MELPTLGFARFLPNTFHFIIHLSSYCAMLYIVATDGVVKKQNTYFGATTHFRRNSAPDFTSLGASGANTLL
jgi:hypothetical protein